jgi:hypothetical protein
MIIPNLPATKWVNEKGHLLPEIHGVLSQLTTQLQQFLSNEGYVVPQQPTTKITALNTTRSIGALLYDSTTNELKVNINGTFKVVQVV